MSLNRPIKNNILQSNDRFITLLFQTRGDERNKVQNSLKCTFIPVGIWERLLGQPRVDVQLPAQK